MCGKISYNDYNNIQKVMELSNLGIICSKDFITQQFPILQNSIPVMIGFTLFVSIALEFFPGQRYTKDTIEIRKMYQEFLTNYNKLNKIFDLNNPIEIQTMFSYLLYKGYLSKEKTFEFSGDQARNIKLLLGTNIFTGKGVCRHISAMSVDILNDAGY